MQTLCMKLNLHTRVYRETLQLANKLEEEDEIKVNQFSLLGLQIFF